MKTEYMYCYSPALFQHLRFKRGQEYICTGKHILTGVQFWQFKRTPELEAAMSEYGQSQEHQRQVER